MISRRPRKALLAAHIAASVGWLGAIAAYVALNVLTLMSNDDGTVRAAYLMMEPVLLYVVIPLALLSLVGGVVQALVTPWGLFRHYWVILSLLTTGFAVVILLLHAPAVRDMAVIARDPTRDVRGLDGDLVHSVGGALVLLFPLVLNVYKPRGLTRYGWRVMRSGTGGRATPTQTG